MDLQSDSPDDAPAIIVVDIPSQLSTADAAALLARHTEFCISTAVPTDTGARVFMSRRKAPNALAMKSRGGNGGFRPNRDNKDGAATAIIKAHPKMSARELAKLLKEHDIKRGKDWVLKVRKR